MDDVPLLLKSEDVKNVHNVFSVLVNSLPSNFGDFIKWVAEVRRPEDGGPLSAEEKARVSIKREVLKQVQETRLFKHVTSFLSNSFWRLPSISGHGDTLPDIAASVCCQGAEILGGKLSASAVYCCSETCMRCLKAEGDKPITIVCGTVVNGNSEQGVDVLIPSDGPCCDCSGPSKYAEMHPASSDLLTALLLALPSTTWVGIKDGQVLKKELKHSC